jgi:hypothetical protein
MILLYALVSYLLLLILSVIYIFARKAALYPFQMAFSFPLKDLSRSLLGSKPKVSRFITQYECPVCGYRSMDQTTYCPHCLEEEKKTKLTAKTIPFQG